MSSINLHLNTFFYFDISYPSVLLSLSVGLEKKLNNLEKKTTPMKRKFKQWWSTIQQISVCLVVFNATFKHISVILWRSILLVEETKWIGENHWPVGSHWQTLLHNVLHLALIEIQTHDISGDRHRLLSCKFNYHTTTAMMASPQISTTL